MAAPSELWLETEIWMRRCFRNHLTSLLVLLSCMYRWSYVFWHFWSGSKTIRVFFLIPDKKWHSFTQVGMALRLDLFTLILV